MKNKLDVSKKPSHTPGPLEWEDGTLYAPNGQPLIVTHGPLEIELMHPESDEAEYADLFRAAPDLLAVARNFEAWASRQSVANLGSEKAKAFNAVVIEARAAIAKAEGGK